MLRHAHTLTLARNLQTGRRLRRHQREPTRIPTRHAQNPPAIPSISANVPKRHSRRRTHTLAQPLPRRRHCSARSRALVRSLLHDIRGLESRTGVLLFLLPASTSCARAQQLRRAARELRRGDARRSPQAECADAGSWRGGLKVYGEEGIDVANDGCAARDEAAPDETVARVYGDGGTGFAVHGAAVSGA